MTHEGNIYNADYGKLLIRTADDFIMGTGLDLGDNDSIDNYYERVCTEEEMEKYWKEEEYANNQE